MEYDGKEISDGETVISTKKPAVWIETDGYFVDRDGNRIDDNDLNDPEKAPVAWVDNAKEMHGDGDGYVRFTIDQGNPLFLFDGEYDHMGYYGSGEFEVKGISSDLTIEIRPNPNDVVTGELSDYSDEQEDSHGAFDTQGVTDKPASKGNDDVKKEGYRVTFVTHGAHIECDGKMINDGDTVYTYEAESSWIETDGYFVNRDGKRIEDNEINDPANIPVSWVDNAKELHGDGDGAVKFRLTEGNPMFKVNGEYDHMGYSGDGNFEIIGISEDITIEVTAPYGRLGDVNGDDKASAKDSMLIQRYAVNISDLDDTQKALADVDNNDKVTNSDALNILRYTVKENVKYSIGEEKII